MNCYLAGIAHYLPERVVTNADLAAENPGWEPEKLYKKTGIRRRHVVSEGETAADLGAGPPNACWSDRPSIADQSIP